MAEIALLYSLDPHLHILANLANHFTYLGDDINEG